MYSAVKRDGGQLQSEASWCELNWDVLVLFACAFCVCARSGIQVVFFPEYYLRFVI